MDEVNPYLEAYDAWNKGYKAGYRGGLIAGQADQDPTELTSEQVFTWLESRRILLHQTHDGSDETATKINWLSSAIRTLKDVFKDEAHAWE